jgi:hypothetical protein
MASGRGIDQLRGDPHTIASLAHASSIFATEAITPPVLLLSVIQATFATVQKCANQQFMLGQKQIQ